MKLEAAVATRSLSANARAKNSSVTQSFGHAARTFSKVLNDGASVMFKKYIYT